MNYLPRRYPAVILCLVLFTLALGYAKLAAAQSVFELTTRGSSCKQNVQGSLLCKYNVGKDLEFSITAVGEPDAGISFLRSNINGDYFARFGVAHGCIIVAQGQATAQLATNDYAFVSPHNGLIYRSWEECRAARR